MINREEQLQLAAGTGQQLIVFKLTFVLIYKATRCS